MPGELAQIEQLIEVVQSSLVGASLLIVMFSIGMAFVGLRFLNRIVNTFDRNAQTDEGKEAALRDMLMQQMDYQRKQDERWSLAFERSNDMASERNSTQRYQAELLEKQNEMHEKQLEQLVVIGKNQTSWHAVIDTDLNNFREHMLMLSTRVNALEDVIDRLAQLMTTEPDSDKAELILTLLQTIATNLDNLNTRFDRMAKIEVTSDGGDDESTAMDAAA